MRDRNLDIYRGAIMIYITCFCHLIWWEGVKVGIFEGSWITGYSLQWQPCFIVVRSLSFPCHWKNRFGLI